MSRNFIPVVLAVVMGVGTGYYTFQPALRELQSNKGTIARSPSRSQSLPAAQQSEQQPQQTVSTLTSTPTPTPTESNTGE
ncbi:hypothetical protein BDW60DRAFT_202332 [Aspergillus nidulans var. acristatus]